MTRMASADDGLKPDAVALASRIAGRIGSIWARSAAGPPSALKTRPRGRVSGPRASCDPLGQVHTRRGYLLGLEGPLPYWGWLDTCIMGLPLISDAMLYRAMWKAAMDAAPVPPRT